MKKYDAVVIGAGNTGLFTAAALAISGVKPLVIEAHNMPGGMATSFVRGRFEFDATLHGHIEANMKDMAVNDLKLETEFPLYPLDVQFVTLQDGKVHNDFYDYSGDIGRQLDEKYPGKGYGSTFNKVIPTINNVRAATIQVLNILGYLKNKDGDEASAWDTVKFGLGIVKKWPQLVTQGLQHTQTFYNRNKVPEYLRSFISMYWWYLGTRLTDSPAFLSFATTDFAYPYAYVKDTAHSFLAELERKIRDNGGDILYNTAVTKIEVRDRKVIGVETSQGDYIRTDHVVSTIDPKIAIGNLLEGDDRFRRSVMKKERKFKENFSFFMVYLGLDATTEEIGIKVPHVIINEELDPNDLHDHMTDLDAPKTIGFMCPNLITEDVSPEGTCIVSISVPVMSSVLEGLSQKEYIKLKNEYSERIIHKVEDYLGIDLTSHIEEIVMATPATFTRYASSTSGALGNYLSTSQFIKVRLLTARINRTIKGLQFTGQFSGNIGYMNMNFGYRHGRKLAKKILKEGR